MKISHKIALLTLTLSIIFSVFIVTGGVSKVFAQEPADWSHLTHPEFVSQCQSAGGWVDLQCGHPNTTWCYASGPFAYRVGKAPGCDDNE